MGRYAPSRRGSWGSGPRPGSLKPPPARQNRRNTRCSPRISSASWIGRRTRRSPCPHLPRRRALPSAATREWIGLPRRPCVIGARSVPIGGTRRMGHCRQTEWPPITSGCAVIQELDLVGSSIDGYLREPLDEPKELSAKESSRPMPRNTTLLPLILIAWAGAPGFAAEGARVDGQNIRIEFDGNMHSRVVAVRAGQESVIGDFTPSEFIRVSGRDVTDFSLQQQKRGPIRDQLGPGSRTILTGIAPPLRKTVTVTVYDAFPRIAIFEVAYTNTGSSDLSVSVWTNQHYSISAPGSAAQPAFWSYQSGSYEKRPDWVLPLKPGFKQENYLGMNASDYGGGTPVVDVWRRDAGIGVGHLEMAPKLVSLPVTEPGPDRATVAACRYAFPSDRKRPRLNPRPPLT